MAFRFQNSYSNLPDRFYARLNPSPVPQPELVKLNRSLANELGLDLKELEGENGAQILGGNLVPEGAAPLAMAYAGHQFAHFVPQLGDGRALLLGEVLDPKGNRFDIQLKGSGPTPFSRAGDGRASLGPVLREYLVSEAMHALGIRTTRSLAAVTTGDLVYRETALPGAVLTRVASSHLRIGTFEYFAVRGDTEGVKLLADYAIDRHYPKLKDSSDPYFALLDSVLEAQAKLVASWMRVGFIHGVMNTDNMSISGETIDYGPCAFMDEYDPQTVFSSIDRRGRYAFARQPMIAQWNLARLAETLIPLMSGGKEKAIEQATQCVQSFVPRFEKLWLNELGKKLGIIQPEAKDTELLASLLERMQSEKSDYTLTFRKLSDAVAKGKEGILAANLFSDSTSFGDWVDQWLGRLGEQGNSLGDCAQLMKQQNPAYIPRNHRVEEALEAAIQERDFSLFESLLTVLSRPYELRAEFDAYTRPPKEDERVLATFCGT